MARDTAKKLRNMVIYSVFVRNYGRSGKFADVEADLERIKALGTDILWLLPIHPIGKVHRKGVDGSPYAIQNYREINPEYGTLEDFNSLLQKAHRLGLKVMIDIVFNHTSPDSYLVENHPEYFYKKPNGDRGNKVGDWYDVVDLDYNNRELWKEQIETLTYWASLGIDGFRCDVAPLVPIEFWIEAREEINKMNPEFIWLSESVEPSFITELRNGGFVAHSDCEIYNAFDMAYDYDVHLYFKGYLSGECSLKEYIDKVAQQEYIYPDNYVKMRFLENHDQPRAKGLITDETKLIIWTAYMFFQKGAALIYNGQEAMDSHTPSLFDIDKVNWDGLKDSFVDYLKGLAKLKKEPIMAKGNYSIGTIDNKDVIIATYELGDKKLIGVFNVGLEEGTTKLPIEDGKYENIAIDGAVNIEAGMLKLSDKPIIISV